MRVVYWGTYDTGKPRNRILIKGLRANGTEVIECHKDIWAGIEDKSQVSGWKKKLGILLRWLSSYPVLIFKYFCLKPHDVVVVGYMGQLDVFMIWPFAKLKGVPVVWDAFLSLYDTIVYDRKMISNKNPLAFLLFSLEWLACRACDKIILDTSAHGKYFIDTFQLQDKHVQTIFVGAEFEVFPSHLKKPKHLEKNSASPFTILFYGQFIPLHGIETVVTAAKLTEEKGFQWVLIGKGQETSKIDAVCKKINPENLKKIEWVPYEELIKWIDKADVGLGIFGNTEKAKRVIPNKVFQMLAAGCPVITGDTPAARELLYPSDMICLVPLDNPAALAGAVEHMALTLPKIQQRHHNKTLINQILPNHIGYKMASVLKEVVSKKHH